MTSRCAASATAWSTKETNETRAQKAAALKHAAPIKGSVEARCEGRSEGWVWMSRYKGKHIGEGMVYRQWARARQGAGLPRELVLYCARHDFGSFVLAKTGNLKAVTNTMGHGDVRSAMVYQHSEREIIRNALNARHISRPTVPDDNQAKCLNLTWIGPQTAFRGC